MTSKKAVVNSTTTKRIVKAIIFTYLLWPTIPPLRMFCKELPPKSLSLFSRNRGSWFKTRHKTFMIVLKTQVKMRYLRFNCQFPSELSNELEKPPKSAVMPFWSHMHKAANVMDCNLERNVWVKWCFSLYNIQRQWSVSICIRTATGK